MEARANRARRLANAGCKTNIARARELIAVPVSVINPPAEYDDPELTASAAAEHRPRCPCCGGRMIIVEFFERGGAPRSPPSSHGAVRTATNDGCGYFIASVTRRRTLPVLQPRCATVL